MKNFSPLLVTLPRSGSTIVCDLLAKIGKHTANYKNNLNEFFETKIDNEGYGTFIHFDQLIIGRVKYIEDLKNTKIKINKDLHKQYIDQITEERFNLLKQHYPKKYMIKLFPNHGNIEILKWLYENYDFIYLERNDKLRQILSYQAAESNNTFLHHSNSAEIISKFYFDHNRFKRFMEGIVMYNNIKNNFPGKTLIYEDIIDNPNEQCLLKKLNLNYPDISNTLSFHTRKVYYKDHDLENLIINKDEWLSVKDELLKNLTEITTI